MQNSKLTSKKPQFKRNLTIRGLTAALILIAALLPVLSVLLINFWLHGNFDWREVALEFAVACVALSLIAYPAYYLLNWESRQATRLDNTARDFKFLIDQAVDMIFLVSMDGHIVEVNQNACIALGYSKSELKAHTMLDIDVECYLHRSPELFERVRQGEKIRYISNFRVKNGKRIPIESQVQLASWMEEPHYIEFVSDISHRIEFEKRIDESKEALEKTRNVLERRIEEHSTELAKQRQSREMAEKYAHSIQNFLEKLIDSMPSAIIAVDKDYQVLQWNIEAEKMTKVKPTEAIGRKLNDLFPELFTHIQKSYLSQDLISQANNFQFKVVINNEKRILEAMVYPIFTLNQAEQGEVIRVDDITEKRLIHETLIQTEKMLSLGGLAAGMAHEINNPLGAIIQSTQNIKRRLSKELDRNQIIADEVGIELSALNSYVEKQRILDFLEGILESGDRAARIVGDMLSFAKPANQTTDKVSLQETLDAAVRLAVKDYDQKKQFNFSNIEIRKTYSPNMVLVNAQKNQLEQVFLNLLINAAQALSTKKQDKPLIELIIRKEGSMACVEVIDNGPGMNAETQKRVFEPFFTTKAQNVGTGLGLSVSYFIVV